MTRRGRTLCALAVCGVPAAGHPQRAAPLVAAQRAAADAPGRPRVTGLRVAGQVAAGTYAGLGGYFVGRAVGTRAADALGASDRDAANAGTVVGVVGAAVATAGAVYGVGSIGDQTGGFGGTLAGTGAGYLVSRVLTALLFRDAPVTTTGAARARWLYTGVEGLLPAIGATVGFTSTRRFDASR